MTQRNESSTTDLLNAWSAGDRSAAGQALEAVYSDLRSIAAAYLRRERTGHTLQATALVHETYLQIFGQQGIEWRNRGHFLGVAARVMRRLLVDHARERNAAKRGGHIRRLPLDDIRERALARIGSRAPDLIALDRALDDLATFEPRQARLVEARFFGGLNVEETADYLGVSRATVIREWRRVKAWLHAELTPEAGRAR